MTTLPSLRLYSAGGVALYSPSRVEHLALGLGRCCAAAAASNGGGFFPADYAPGHVALTTTKQLAYMYGGRVMASGTLLLPLGISIPPFSSYNFFTKPNPNLAKA